jgi:DNA-binding MarR family transcriptional regulator
MSMLMVEEEVDFNSLKERLAATDGNIASHTTALEKLGYIRVDKSFVGRKTRTTYMKTELGSQAFKDHLDALEKLIRR